MNFPLQTRLLHPCHHRNSHPAVSWKLLPQMSLRDLQWPREFSIANSKECCQPAHKAAYQQNIQSFHSTQKGAVSTSSLSPRPTSPPPTHRSSNSDRTDSISTKCPHSAGDPVPRGGGGTVLNVEISKRPWPDKIFIKHRDSAEPDSHKERLVSPKDTVADVTKFLDRWLCVSVMSKIEIG